MVTRDIFVVANLVVQNKVTFAVCSDDGCNNVTDSHRPISVSFTWRHGYTFNYFCLRHRDSYARGCRYKSTKTARTSSCCLVPVCTPRQTKSVSVGLLDRNGVTSNSVPRAENTIWLWRGSVVKSEGVRVSQGKTSYYKPTEIRFRFGRQKMDYLVILGFYRFGRKWLFIFLLFFVFVPKMSFALGRKCYVCNWTITNFYDIGTDDFRFRFLAENGISFSFTAENENCFCGRSLHQTVSDYFLHQWLWFSNTQQSQFRTASKN